MRLMTDDITILACAWLGLIGIHHQIMRTVFDLFWHE